jgi:ResB-like family protein
MTRVLKTVYEALCSFWLAITVLAFLFLLTVLGTIEQTHSSLYEVQKRYFESAFVVHKVYGIPVPLPGVYLLLVVLFVNLVCGGIVRIRKDRTTWGIVVAHLGILVMLLGAAVEFTWSQKGHATLSEGSTTAEFQSYYDWEIAIAEAKVAGPVTEEVVPGEQFAHLTNGRSTVFSAQALPFDLEVHDFLPNCEPRLVPGAKDGVALAEMPRHKEAEQDEAGAHVTVLPKNGGPEVTGLLWSRQRAPLTVAVDGRRYTIDLTHRRFPMPFAIHLDDFRREMHPGTGMAKSFESDVTKLQAGVPQKVKISMNQPLRQSGYTLYQSGFMEPGSGGGRWWSTFSVVKNPADDVPLVSCVIVTAGLLLHFAQKLVRHVRTQRWRNA